jgi:hypothetical protein
MVVAPFMGTALKFLFGTADNNDVIQIHRHIDALKETAEKTVHIAELQAIQTLYNDKLAQEVHVGQLIGGKRRGDVRCKEGEPSESIHEGFKT